MKKQRTLLDKVNLFTVILADPDLPANSKVVAGWLLFRHHNTITGVCTPSNRTVGAALGIRPENVSRNIGKLVKAGYLIVRRRFATSNSYDFDWSKGSKAALNAIKAGRREVDSEGSKLTETTRPIDENNKPPCSNRQDFNDENVNLILESNTRIEDGNLTLGGENEGLPIHLGERDSYSSKLGQSLQVSSDELVARFCSIYPLVIADDDISAVRAALVRALTTTSFETILEGAMRYAMECVDREAKFIADPTNWLNGGRWRSSEKIKADAAVIGADENAVPINRSRPPSRCQEILLWKPSKKNPFSLQ